MREFYRLSDVLGNKLEEELPLLAGQVLRDVPLLVHHKASVQKFLRHMRTRFQHERTFIGVRVSYIGVRITFIGVRVTFIGVRVSFMGVRVISLVFE